MFNMNFLAVNLLSCSYSLHSFSYGYCCYLYSELIYMIKYTGDHKTSDCYFMFMVVEWTFADNVLCSIYSGDNINYLVCLSFCSVCFPPFSCYSPIHLILLFSSSFLSFLFFFFWGGGVSFGFGNIRWFFSWLMVVTATNDMHPACNRELLTNDMHLHYVN